MDKMVVTILLMVAGVVGSLIVINTAMPIIHKSGSDLVNVADNLDNRIQSDVQIIQVIGELDSGGNFSDTDSDGRFDIFVWVKNVGKVRIDDIPNCEVFYGQTGDFQRITYSPSQAVFPCWRYSLEGGATEWGISNTCKFELSFSSAEAAGTYWVKVILPNGIEDEKDFAM